MGIIATTLASLAPGQFAQAIVAPPQDGFRVRPPSGSSYDMLDWTPRCHWDAQREQLVVIGKRKIVRALAYSDSTGAWRDLPLPAHWTTTETTGHWYGWSAHDGQDRIFAMGWELDLAAETWEQMAPPPSNLNLNGSNGTMMAWMGDTLARYGTDRQYFLAYDPITRTWPTARIWCNHGAHALVEYHPQHDACLVVGGNVVDLRDENGERVLNPNGTRVRTSPRRASLITAGGVVTQVADIPEVVSMSAGSWIVPHPAGCWVVRSHISSTVANLWAYWPGTDTWQALGPSPDRLLKYPTAAVVDDCVLIAHTTGVSAYRMPALT